MFDSFMRQYRVAISHVQILNILCLSLKNDKNMTIFSHYCHPSACLSPLNLHKADGRQYIFPLTNKHFHFWPFLSNELFSRRLTQKETN